MSTEQIKVSLNELARDVAHCEAALKLVPRRRWLRRRRIRAHIERQRAQAVELHAALERAHAPFAPTAPGLEWGSIYGRGGPARWSP